MPSFDEIRKKIRPTDRVIMSPREIRNITSVSAQEIAWKPKGLWYGIGTSWIDWVEREEPGWKGEYIYKIKLAGGVLQITNRQQLQKFHDDYQAEQVYGGGQFINWKPVAYKWKGIEIAPYQGWARMKLTWYYPWDVASGCIWNAAAISKFIRVEI